MEDLNSSGRMSSGASSSTVDFDKLISLFTSQASSELYDRHITAIERLCKSNPNGFAIRDLPKVQQILEISLELLKKGKSDFFPPVMDLIRTLTKPYVKRTSTDEFKMLNNIANMLTCVGKIFSPEFPATLQLIASELLSQFATAHGNRPSALELTTPVNELDASSSTRQYHTNQSLIGRSGVMRAVIRGLATAIVAADQNLIFSLVSTLLSFSYLPDSCLQLVDAGVLSCMPHALGHDFKHPLTPIAVELLWNLLEHAPDAMRAALAAPQKQLTRLIKGEGAQPSTSGAADFARPGSSARASTSQPAAGSDGSPSSLDNHVLAPLAGCISTLFNTLLIQGFRAVDKELRNDVLLVANLLLEAGGPQAAAAMHEAGMFQAVLAVATTPELGDRFPELVKPWALSYDEIDYEVKQLSWRAATLGCERSPEGVLELANANGLMRVLLQYVDSTSAGSMTGTGFGSAGGAGSPLPGAAATLTTVSAAGTITRRGSSAGARRWNADQAAALRLAALSRLHALAPLAPEAYLAENGPAILLRFLQTCGVHAHLEGALRHLHHLVTCVPELAEALGAAGALRELLGLMQDAALPQGVREFALLLVAVLCRLNAENMRRLRHENGVQVLLAQLVRARTADPTLPSPYIVAVLDAVWAAVVPDRKNLARFLVEDGMDALINFLEVCNRSHRVVALSVLADMLEYPKAHKFFHEWQSDKDKSTAAHLLITLWKEEDSLRGMTVDGVLSNTTRPLAGLDKRTQWVAPETVMYGNLSPDRKAALERMSSGANGEGMLAKVYSVFRLLGFDTFPYLDQQDQAALCVIEKYIKFRQGEVWRGIKEEFEATNMRPTAPDRERLASGIELCEHLAKVVQDTQAGILGKHTAELRAREAKFFEDMLAQRKLEQEARFYQKDKSTLTMAELREAKQKKEAMLRNSINQFKFMDPELNAAWAAATASQKAASMAAAAAHALETSGSMELEVQ